MKWLHMIPGIVELQLGQSSGQAQAVGGPSDAVMFRDYLADLDRGDDAVGFTETHRRMHVLKRACDEQGYQLHTDPSSDVALAVRDEHKIVAAGLEPGNAASPGHTARPVLWVTFEPKGTYELVTVHEAHWLTRKRAQPGDRIELTQAMAETVATHAHGRRLGFWMGDTNTLDTDSDRDPMAARGLVSCWDELGRYPDTHPGGPDAPIDVVGKWDLDGRARCVRAHTWHQLHTDHLSVSAWYRIRGVKAR